MKTTDHYIVIGGAGFIGGHLCRHLITNTDAQVTVYDNFSSGTRWRLDEVANNPRLTVVEGDVKDLPSLREAMSGKSCVYHFAANPDIAKATTQPDIDFWEGTYLVQNVIEAMRTEGVQRLIYASGSGVYGDTGETPVHENYAPLLPISTYGASKLACEALICAYCHMFDLKAAAFRFANVVGPRQTHGVTYDFIRRLLAAPDELVILGDGSQSKSYIHVDDVIAAMRLIESRGAEGFEFFNVATEDYVTVNEIADMVTKSLNLQNVNYTYTGGKRGWKGDVPFVRFDAEKIRALGWRNRRTAAEALLDSIDSIISDAKGGKFN